MKFNVTMERDEDGAWVTECPSIPGCVSQGKTQKQALDNIKEAIALCLKVRAEKGLPLGRRDAASRGRDVMPTLPLLSGKEVTRSFEKLGWTVARRKSNHIILTKKGETATLSVPNHQEVAKGTLRSLIRLAGLTVDEFSAVM